MVHIAVRLHKLQPLPQAHLLHVPAGRAVPDGLVQVLADHVAALKQQELVQVILSVEVDIERARRHPRPAGDIVDGRVVVTLLVKLLGGGTDDAVERLPPFFGFGPVNQGSVIQVKISPLCLSRSLSDPV